MANLNLNKAILAGRLTAEPELKTTQSGISVVRFSVAISRRFAKEGQERQTDFINVVAWRQQAEFVSRYFHKGSSICVVGSIQTSTSTDPTTNQKRYWTEVVADEINFVDSKSESGSGYAPAGGAPAYTPDSYGAPTFKSGSGSAPQFEEMSNEDDLPF